MLKLLKIFTTIQENKNILENSSQKEWLDAKHLSKVLIRFILFAVVSKPSDCIFPYDFKEAVRKKVSGDGAQFIVHKSCK